MQPGYFLTLDLRGGLPFDPIVSAVAAETHDEAACQNGIVGLPGDGRAVAPVGETHQMMSEHRFTAAKATNPLVKSNRNVLSFREVHDAYFRFARRTLRRLGVRDADLMDMTQNVFIVVHRQLPRFEGRSKLTTWLYGICRRIATDYLRSARIRREELVDNHGIESLSRRGVATYAPDRSSVAAFVKSALDRLPENQRIVFLLFADEDIRAQDIAALLDIPEGTVRSRLRRARATLKHEAALHKRIGVRPLLTRTFRN